MTRDDIIRMAREAGFHEWYSNPERGYHFGCAMKFATLVAAAEREACAKLCDDLERQKWESVHDIQINGGRLRFVGPVHCATAIRARSQP